MACSRANPRANFPTVNPKITTPPTKNNHIFSEKTTTRFRRNLVERRASSKSGFDPAKTISNSTDVATSANVYRQMFRKYVPQSRGPPINITFQSKEVSEPELFRISAPLSAECLNASQITTCLDANLSSRISQKPTNSAHRTGTQRIGHSQNSSVVLRQISLISNRY